MSNIHSHPNHLHLGGDVTVGARFGTLVNCHPVNLAGQGHTPHIEARFTFGLKLELDRATAVAFARALTESVESLPFSATDVHDATAGETA